MVGFFRFLAAVLFVLAIPLIIITSNIRWLLLDASFYDSGQSKHQVAKTSGLTQQQLLGANRAIVSYFASSEDDLAADLRQQGLPSDFFNQRETVHLRDVRGLVQMVFSVHFLVVGYGTLFLIGSFLLGRKGFLGSVAGRLLWGAGLTVLLLGVFGAISLVDWNQLFLLFHLVSFDNDFWLLNPSTDRMITMYPPSFFFDAAVTMAGNAISQSVALGLLATVVFVFDSRWRRPQQAQN